MILIVGIVSLSLSIGHTLYAQDAYPTVTALRDALIPARDRIALARELLGITEIEAPRTTPETYTLGDVRTFRALNTDANRVFEFEAALLGIGEHVYVWVDTRAQNIEPGSAQGLADVFDAEIYPQVRDLWGSELTPGLDADPRVFALFTDNLGQGIGAYYSHDNSYPMEIAPSSNEHEMFIYQLSAMGTDLDRWGVQSTTAHEFQHMIRANVNPNPDTWFNEGLSVFTQLYLGYPDGAMPARSYYSAPQTQLNTWAESGSTLPHYGSALLWTTYFYERYGLKALQTVSLDRRPSMTAFDSILREFGEPGVDAVFADWVVANWWNDVALADGQYGYTLIPAGNTPFTEYLDEYPSLIDGDANQYSAEYFALEVLPEGENRTLTLDFTAPSTVQLIPTDAASGQQMWYSNRRDDSVTTLTRAFDLTNVAAQSEITLEYSVWYMLENLWDYGYVMVSTDGGATWQPLSTPNMTDNNPHGTAYGSGYTGRSREWLREALSLEAYRGQQILVRFALITDDATTQHGMAIDDVRVSAVDYASDFEADGGGWTAEGWVWIDNVLPQQIWVQVAQQAGDQFELTRWLYPADETIQVDLLDDAETVMIALSPFAPQTTVDIEYTLAVDIE
jgi:hypothetical protein